MSVLLQEKTKPILSVDEQIDKLKENGVTFKYVSEDNAKEYLRKNNYYLIQILYIIFDYSHKHYTFKQFEV